MRDKTITTVAARLETDEQAAHNVADLVVERFAVEDVAVALTDAGGGRWRVSIHFGTMPDSEAVRSLVAAAAGAAAAKALTFEPIAEKDWVNASLAGLQPVAAGRFTVHGAHDRARIAVNRIGIEVEASLAFGTGHHGTTRGCLLALDRLCKTLKTHRVDVRRHPGTRAQRRALRILDLGTGSGVLAIAAARALRCRVLATDIDASAVGVARANGRLNRVGNLIEVVRADGVARRELRTHAPFDVALANILLGPLQRFAATLTKLTAPGGRLIVSGLLSAQANAALAAYRPLALERRIDCDGWTTLVFIRRRRRPNIAARRAGP